MHFEIIGDNTDIEPIAVGKRLELLMESVPGILRMAIVWNPGLPRHAIWVKET